MPDARYVLPAPCAMTLHPAKKHLKDKSKARIHTPLSPLHLQLQLLCLFLVLFLFPFRRRCSAFPRCKLQKPPASPVAQPSLLSAFVASYCANK